MTADQLTRLYFPSWRRAFAHNWTRTRGKISRRRGAIESRWVCDVEETAASQADHDLRIWGEQDLRRAANGFALSRYAEWAGDPITACELLPSCHRLDDAHGIKLGLFLALCDLLVDPDNLGASDPPSGVFAWENPDCIRRKFILQSIASRCRPEYVLDVIHAIHGVRDPALLDTPALLNFYRLMGQRKKAWR